MELLKKVKNKKFWQEVREKPTYAFLLNEITEKYQECCLCDPPILKYSEYKFFFETGDRKVYEEKYFKRRRQLCILTLMSLIYPENKKYLLQLQDVVWAILDEYCWALPAHVANNTVEDDTFIDLFAAETGITLSEVFHFLGDRLDSLLKDRIKNEIDRRIIRSYLERENEFWWDVDCENNWASVCAGSVGATFLYMRPELFETVKSRIDADMERYLKGFYKDGICREGLCYWTYGFGFYAFYCDLLKQFSDGRYDGFRDEHIKEIAMAQQKCYLQEDVTVSFGDSGMHCRSSIGLTHYLKSVYSQVEVLPTQYSFVLDHCGRWFMASRAFLYFNSDYINADINDEKVYYMEDSEWFVKKSKYLAFAAKAGNNDESHNHNDVGTFIVAAGGQQILCDLGAGEYTKQYFDVSSRYEIFCNSSYGHSVPIFDGTGQSAGKEFSGAMTYEGGLLRIDMTAAYALCKLKSLTRTFHFDQEHIWMRDDFWLADKTEITERFVTLIEPKICDTFIQVGVLRLFYRGGNWKVSINQQTHVNHNGEKITVYCIDFVCIAETVSFDLQIQNNKSDLQLD